MAPATPETPAESIRKQVENLQSKPTEEQLAELKEECQKLQPEEQEDLRKQLETVKAAVEATQETETEKKLIQLEVITALLEQLASSDAPKENNAVIAPTQKLEGGAQGANLDITSAGRETGSTVGGFVGEKVGGMIDGVKNLALMEWEMAKNRSYVGTGFRVLGIATAGFFGYKLLKRFVAWGKDEKGKSKSPWYWKVLAGLGIIAGATWGLSAVSPWAEKKIAEEKILHENAQQRLAARSGTPTNGAPPDPSENPSSDPIATATPDVAPSTTLTSKKIEVDGKQVDFAVTSNGVEVGPHRYKLSVERPTIAALTVIEDTLYPNITDAQWVSEGLRLTGNVTYTSRGLLSKEQKTKTELEVIPQNTVEQIIRKGADGGRSFSVGHTAKRLRPIIGGTMDIPLMLRFETV